MKPWNLETLRFINKRFIFSFGLPLILCLILAGPINAQQNNSTQGNAIQYKVTNLLGQTIINEQEQEIGQVTEVLVSTGQKEVQVILSVGGFLGLGDKLISVPLSELTQKQGRLICDLCKKEIQEKPEITFPKGGRGPNTTY
ncbi:MAG: PRC-barrel domain-containing protein [Desulfovermiculus sp.]|nr:PRC-barrel domain-containing protein [Desulfovermiculus sp.]